LVDVDSADGATKGGFGGGWISGWAADGVVEDEGAVGAGTGEVLADGMERGREGREGRGGEGRGGEGGSPVFQELVDFFVVIVFDLLFVEEIFLLADVGDELETVAIEIESRLVAGYVVDGDLLGIAGSLVCLWLSYVGRCRRGTVFIGLVELEDGVHILFLRVLLSSLGRCWCHFVGKRVLGWSLN
jgi:hypothetical protein